MIFECCEDPDHIDWCCSALVLRLTWCRACGADNMVQTLRYYRNGFADALERAIELDRLPKGMNPEQALQTIQALRDPEIERDLLKRARAGNIQRY